MMNLRLCGFLVLLVFGMVSPVWGTLPTLPSIPDISCAAPTGVTWNAATASDFTTALASAAPGDVIKLTAGNTFTGTFTLPNKAGNGPCITIRTSAADSTLPSSTQRLKGAYLVGLPKIVSPGANAPAITTVAGSHHFQFIGVEIAQCATCTDLFLLVKIGLGTETLQSNLPHHIVFDRVYIHGDPSLNIQHCLVINGASISVLNSYISECHHTGSDTQAIGAWNGSGPFRIINNYLEASTENILFGGADPTVPNLVASDILIQSNWFNKPLTWKTDDSSYAGTHWSVKNLFEIKNARRVLVDSNLFTNSWADGQIGYAFVLKSSNSNNTAPWSECSNITIQNNVIRHAGQGLYIESWNGVYSSIIANTFLIKNNLWVDVGTTQWVGGGQPGFIFEMGPTDDVAILHNTEYQVGSIGSVVSEIGVSQRWVYQNNLTLHNTYGIFCNGLGTGNICLDNDFPGVVFDHNVLFGSGNNGQYYTHYTDHNSFPNAASDIGFLDYTNGEYQLKATSTYANAGSDGTDIGADIPGLLAVEAVALSGNLPGTYLAASNRPAMTANPATTNTPRATRRPSL